MTKYLYYSVGLGWCCVILGLIVVVEVTLITWYVMDWYEINRRIRNWLGRGVEAVRRLRKIDRAEHWGMVKDHWEER